MRPQWKELPRDEVHPVWSDLYATLNTRGTFMINKRTWNRLEQPEAVVILFDSVNNRIGLRPATLETRNAYRVCHSTRHGGKRIRAYRLLTEYGLNLPETLQFQNVTTDDDGVLILDLRTAKPSARAAARRLNWQKRRAGSEI